MASNIIAVEFHVNAQLWRDGQLTIPKEICQLLSIWQGDTIAVVITDRNSLSVIFAGREELKSGNEIYSDQLRASVERGHAIIVRVSPVAPLGDEKPAEG